MKNIFFKVKFRDKNTNYNKILELLKLSAENNIIHLNYNISKKECSNQSLEIIATYYKKYIKRNNGKMIYEKTKNKEIKILNKEFIIYNIKRAKMIINNKQYELKDIVENNKKSFKIEIKFLDNIIYLNSMFKYCKSLSGVYNFENFNTKYLKTIYELFEGCDSLISIDDISNWNIKNINNITKLFYIPIRYIIYRD